MDQQTRQAFKSSMRRRALRRSYLFLVPLYPLIIGATPQAVPGRGFSIDWSGGAGLIAALLGVAAAFLTVRNERLKSKLAKADLQLESFRKFCATVYSTHHVATDLFVLGPRAHGKTSLVTAFTKQWQAVENMQATPTHFQHFVWEAPNYVESQELDREIGMMRPVHTRALLNIYDYAGEDRSIGVALKAISSSHRFLVLFIMSCEDMPTFASAAYFNLATLKSMRTAIAQAHSEPLSALIIFCKQDVSPFAGHADPSNIPAALLQKNAAAIENIEAIFGSTGKFLVSAETGFGLSAAIRRVLAPIVNDQGLPIAKDQ